MVTETSKTERKRKKETQKKKTPKVSLNWDTYKRCNIHTMRAPEREETGKRTEAIYKTVMTDNFPKLMSSIKPQIQEALRKPKATLGHIIYKIQNFKEKRKKWKKTEGKYLIYRKAKTGITFTF